MTLSGLALCSNLQIVCKDKQIKSKQEVVIGVEFIPPFKALHAFIEASKTWPYCQIVVYSYVTTLAVVPRQRK